MMLFCSAPSPGVPYSLPIGSLRGEGAKMQSGKCTRFVLVLQLFFLRLTAPQKPSHLVGPLTPAVGPARATKTRRHTNEIPGHHSCQRKRSAPTCLLSLRLARRRRSCAPAMFAGTPTSATSIRRDPFTRTTGVGGLTSASRFVRTEAEATGPATSGPNFNRTRPTCTPRPLNRAASFF
jgi:hypothetical protein